MRDIPDLRPIVREKILAANRQFLAKHDLEGVRIAEENTGQLYTEQQVSERVINFDPAARHVGSLLGGRVFRLLQATLAEQTGETNLEFEQRMRQGDFYDRLHTNPLVIEVKVMEPKTEVWGIWLTDDAPPYAINGKDASQVGTSHLILDATQRVHRGFGEDAMPVLSPDEVSLLAAAIVATEAKILPPNEEF